MKTPNALDALSAQVPPAPSPAPTTPGGGTTQPGTGTPPTDGFPVGDAVGIGAAGLFVLLMVLAARKLFFRKRAPEPGRKPGVAVPPEKDKPAPAG
ncbi:signal recognition particle-docking protein FtsY, partial [Pyxidicoccus sp. 3LFB2]